MADETLSGFADNFQKGMASGQSSALGFAQMKMEVEQKQAKQEHDRQQLQETRDQHEYEKGKYAMDELTKIIDMDAGPGQNLRLKFFRKHLAKFNGDADPESGAMLEAMVKDPSLVGDARIALGSIMRKPPEERAAILREITPYLGSKEIIDKIKEFNAADAAQELQKQGKDLEARNEAQKAKTIKPEHVLALNDKVDAHVKDFERQNGGWSAVNLAFRDAKGNLDFEKPIGGGQADLSAVKGITQFNDSAAVRDGDVAVQKAMASWLDRAALLEIQIKRGDMLSPTMRKQLFNVAQSLALENQRRIQSKLVPIVEQAKAQGVPLNQVLSSQQLDLYNTKLPERATPKFQLRPPDNVNFQAKSITETTAAADIKRTKEEILTEAGPEKVAAVASLAKKVSRAEIKKRLPGIPDELLDAIGVK